MIENLKTSHERKYFFLVVGLLLVVIFLLRYFVLPNYYESKVEFNYLTLYSILENFFVSFLITIGLGLFVFWLLPKNRANAQMRILQPIEIGSTIVNARVDTEKWFFNGGSGRYTRSQTLPFLAELSRQKNRGIDVSILIMNPKNESLCQKYADYKNSLRTAKMKGKRDIKSVKVDLISTIVSCHVWKYEQSSLNIKLGLKDSFSLFRTDISSNAAIITKEDPSEPAIYYEKETFFYIAHIEDLKQTFNQVNVIEILPFCSRNELDVKKVEELLKKLGLDAIVDQKDFDNIVSNVLDNKNPYE
jgi:hypothetical protein